MNFADFEDLLVLKKQKRNIRGAVTYVNRYQLNPYEWEKVINEKIWYASRKKCGYSNKNSYVSVNKTSGSFQGKCACGSEITCQFKQVGDEMVFTCVTTPGDGRCRKLFLRQSHRLKAGEKAAKGTTDTYQAELADKYLQEGDPACPLIPNAPVLRMAKSSYNNSKYWHKDPFVALTLMEATTYKEDIHHLTFKPFGVHYWTNSQRQAYNRYASTGHRCVFIDATGGIYPTFTKFNGAKTHNSFLYVIVVNADGEQFSVAQMVSEAHDTVVIRHFWDKWLQHGFIKPHEVVMDSSRALLTATISALTGYATIESYADTLWTDAAINCYIRLDIAHFMAMYSRILKSSPTLVKRFWLACLGKLVFITNTAEMRRILQKMFVVGLFSRSGRIQGKTELCLAQKDINFLRDTITDSHVISMVDTTLEAGQANEKSHEKNNPEDCDIFGDDINDFTISEELNDEDPSPNSWSAWGRDIFQDVEDKMNEKTGNGNSPNEDNGGDPNPYHCPHFIHRLVKDISTIPLWSAVSHHKFNYGRIPASSASVECEIKKIKHNLYKKTGKQRVDNAIERHLDYLQGRLKLVNIAVNEKRQACEDKDEGSEGTAHQEDDDTSSERIDDSQESPHRVVVDNLRHQRSAQRQPVASTVSKGKNRKPLTEIIDNSNAANISSEIVNDVNASILRTSPPVANSTSISDDEDEMDHCFSKLSPDCVACSNSDLPQGAHWCKICKIPVHPFEKCSFPVDDEEGYNTARICCTCYSMPKAHTSEFIAKNHTENWMNKGKQKENQPMKCLPKKKNGGLYVGNNADRLKEMLLYHKSRGLPILRNGGSRGLQAVKLKDREISLVNTCPFDSIFQILLSGACDYPALSSHMSNASDNELYRFVIAALQRPLTAYTYRKRAEILMPYFKLSRTINTIEVIDCRMEIGSFAKKIFAPMPSWIEKSKCDCGCPERETFFPVISLNARALEAENFENVFDSWIFSHEIRKCCNRSCNGEETIVENIVGDLIVFEPYGENGECVSRKLKSLPREFKHPQDNAQMKLIGVIHFVAPAFRRRDDINAMGHYVARSLRLDGKWIEYDDTVQTGRTLRDSVVCNVALMIYAKNYRIDSSDKLK